MPLLKRLQSYLDANRVPYELVSHPKVYTAHDVAQSLDVPGKLVAKVVVVKADGYFVMTVLPSTWRVDLKRLRDVLEAREVRLATEPEIANLFPDCQVGAMPPFGNLYGMDVYVAEGLTQNDEIAFNAGSHTEVIRMAYKDFERLVQPKVMSFTT